MGKLRGKCVVITGAASGIGAALARDLARQGAHLLLADVDEKRLMEVLEALAPDLTAHSAQAHAMAADVADLAQVQALADRAFSLWGGVDVLVNNAGVALVSPLASIDLADAHWLMGINFWGVVYGSKVFQPLLKGRPGATIVNISSVFAMVSLPTQSLYNASKAAVRAFSDALREELRDQNIAVLCVHPGGVRTRIVEQARIGQDISMAAPSAAALRENFARIARTSPEQAAAAISGAIERGDTRLLIGVDARIGDLMFRLFPAKASAWFTALARKQREKQLH